MRTALAFLNYGTWKVMCPEPGCDDARAVYHPLTGARLTEDVCAAGHPFTIVMPAPELEAQIVAVLAGRVADADKAWYPAGHEWAIVNSFPTGQTVDQLVDENAEVARYRAAQDEARKAQLAEVLAGLGVQVRDDGTFEGQIL